MWCVCKCACYFEELYSIRIPSSLKCLEFEYKSVFLRVSPLFLYLVTLKFTLLFYVEFLFKTHIEKFLNTYRQIQISKFRIFNIIIFKFQVGIESKSAETKSTKFKTSRLCDQSQESQCRFKMESVRKSLAHPAHPVVPSIPPNHISS